MSRGHRRTQRHDKAASDLFEQVGAALVVFEKRMETMEDEGVQLTGMTVRLPNDERPDYLVILRAQGENAGLVGFHGGMTLHDAMRGALERLYNRTIKWREDQYDG